MTDEPQVAFSDSGPGWQPPAPGEAPSQRERNTENVHSLLTKTNRDAFLVWCRRRNMTPSAGVRALIVDALWREASGKPLGALYGDLPADLARLIVTEAQAPQTAAEA